MRRDDTNDQPALFSRTIPPPRRRPLSETHPALVEYREAWEREYGRSLTLPSFAETARHAKAIAALIPDTDERRAFFAAYLSDRSPFLVRVEHALRYAVTTPAFSRYRRVAAWAAAERRRFATTPPPRQVLPSARRFGVPWTVEAFNASGAIVETHEVWAGTRQRAEDLAAAWWMREAPFGVHHVVVRNRGEA